VKTIHRSFIISGIVAGAALQAPQSPQSKSDFQSGSADNLIFKPAFLVRTLVSS
jgi:hypothetical protein